MPIQVTCPSCHKRFSVSEKFAGQTGPCPQCKQPIKVPEKDEEVVIHTPENFGPKDAAGEAVLKPIERSDSRVSPVVIAGIVAACLGIVVVAFLLGRAYPEGSVPLPILAIGAIVLGPPLALGGYSLFRDHELEPHRGSSVLIRSLVCGLIYAALWGALMVIKTSVLGGEVEMFQLVFVIPALVAAGAVAGLASLEMDFMSGALHYGLYLFVTVMLRLVMGLSLF